MDYVCKVVWVSKNFHTNNMYILGFLVFAKFYSVLYSLYFLSMCGMVFVVQCKCKQGPRINCGSIISWRLNHQNPVALRGDD